MRRFRSRHWVSACERAKLKTPARFHDLRHTGISLAVRAGVHPRVIQSWAGHSSIETTMNIYGHLYEDAGKEMTDKMQAKMTADDQAESDADVVALGS